ncbi:tetratricopeptide repeat protein [Methylophaga sp. OBS4]|uniref:tetratricopeptide repeat protein n=1 Tax=Methylophaga sp. OBS4 TaxID=2991935 RepID=UPI00225441BE|nr:hypothetical protein [Methylophaga sp. OBS4]MCX4186845.1 hypothetical protein [Methylophaga sp. OBS4]
MKLSLYLTAFVMLTLSALSLADVQQDVSQLQKRWAQINYTMKGEDQNKSFEDLIEQANQAVASNPGSAETLIWRGIIQSSYAGAKGGLGALSLAKAARADLEQALKINDKALAGSAYTSLGTLYFKVPGWPLGFGNDGKAEALLKKALLINPNGIDSNYFYGEFLAEQRKYEQAEKYLLKAQQAPARPERPLADKGRHQEINAALDKVRYQLKSQSHASITH